VISLPSQSGTTKARSGAFFCCLFRPLREHFEKLIQDKKRAGARTVEEATFPVTASRPNP